MHHAVIERIAEVVLAGSDVFLTKCVHHSHLVGKPKVVVLSTLLDPVDLGLLARLLVDLRDHLADSTAQFALLEVCANRVDAALHRRPDRGLNLMRLPPEFIGKPTDFVLREDILRSLIERLVSVVEGKRHPHIHRRDILVEFGCVDLDHQVLVERVGLDAAPRLAVDEKVGCLLVCLGEPGVDRNASLPLVIGGQRHRSVRRNRCVRRIDGDERDDLLCFVDVSVGCGEDRLAGVLVPHLASLAFHRELPQLGTQLLQLDRGLADPLGRSDEPTGLLLPLLLGCLGWLALTRPQDRIVLAEL